MIFTEAVQSHDIEILIEDLHNLLDIWEANHLHEASTVGASAKGRVFPWMKRKTEKAGEAEEKSQAATYKMSRSEQQQVLRGRHVRPRPPDEPEEPVDLGDSDPRTDPKETLRAMILRKEGQLEDAIKALGNTVKNVRGRRDLGKFGAQLVAMVAKKKAGYIGELEGLRKIMRNLEVHDAPEAAYRSAVKGAKKNKPAGGKKQEAYELGYRFGTAQDQVDAFFHELVRRPTYGEDGRLL